MLKESEPLRVLKTLQPYIEQVEKVDPEAPVRVCYRYSVNRLHQLDYKTAIKEGLPMGSGEIESAHRYVVQKRLKIAGAGWCEQNATDRLVLRINRANGLWDNYWNERKVP